MNKQLLLQVLLIIMPGVTLPMESNTNSNQTDESTDQNNNNNNNNQNAKKKAKKDPFFEHIENLSNELKNRISFFRPYSPCFRLLPADELTDSPSLPTQTANILEQALPSQKTEVTINLSPTSTQPITTQSTSLFTQDDREGIMVALEHTIEHDIQLYFMSPDNSLMAFTVQNPDKIYIWNRKQNTMHLITLRANAAANQANSHIANALITNDGLLALIINNQPNQQPTTYSKIVTLNINAIDSAEIITTSNISNNLVTDGKYLVAYHKQLELLPQIEPETKSVDIINLHDKKRQILPVANAEQTIEQVYIQNNQLIVVTGIPQQGNTHGKIYVKLFDVQQSTKPNLKLSEYLFTIKAKHAVNGLVRFIGTPVLSSDFKYLAIPICFSDIEDNAGICSLKVFELKTGKGIDIAGYPWDIGAPYDNEAIFKKFVVCQFLPGNNNHFLFGRFSRLTLNKFDFKKHNISCIKTLEFADITRDNSPSPCSVILKNGQIYSAKYDLNDSTSFIFNITYNISAYIQNIEKKCNKDSLNIANATFLTQLQLIDDINRALKISCGMCNKKPFNERIEAITEFPDIKKGTVINKQEVSRLFRLYSELNFLLCEWICKSYNPDYLEADPELIELTLPPKIIDKLIGYLDPLIWDKVRAKYGKLIFEANDTPETEIEEITE